MKELKTVFLWQEFFKLTVSTGLFFKFRKTLQTPQSPRD